MPDTSDADPRALVHHPDTVDVQINDVEPVEGDDGLSDVIADLESRLNTIRETHLEQEMLEVDVLTREGELIVYRDDIAERERAITDNEIELRDREIRLEQERGEFARQRDRITQHLRELEELEEALAAQVEEQVSENQELGQERASIESRREELQGEQQNLLTRECEVKSKADEIAAEREQISSAQAHLSKDKKVLEEQAQAQAQLAEQLDKMRSDLADREKELESKLAEHDELRGMLANMSSQLDESKAEAKAQAEHYESMLSKRADDERRNEDLERRCRTLETERSRVRQELTKVRQEMTSPDAQAASTPSMKPLAFKARKAPTRASQFGGMIWFISMGIVAAGLAVTWGGSALVVGMATLGAGAALCILASHILLGRGWDTSMLLVVGFAGSFGLWFPHWLEIVTTAITLWEVPSEILPAAWTDRMPMAFSAGTASLALGICIYLLTSAPNLLGHAIFATIVAVGVLMIPSQSIQLQVLAAVLWMAIISASMVKWAVLTTKQESGHLN